MLTLYLLRSSWIDPFNGHITFTTQTQFNLLSSQILLLARISTAGNTLPLGEEQLARSGFVVRALQRGDLPWQEQRGWTREGQSPQILHCLLLGSLPSATILLPLVQYLCNAPSLPLPRFRVGFGNSSPYKSSLRRS